MSILIEIFEPGMIVKRFTEVYAREKLCYSPITELRSSPD
jgi:hypothetical protein